MDKVYCLDCENWNEQFGCKYDFRWASNAGGRKVDNRQDVYRCMDFEEIPKVLEEDDSK